MSSSMFLGGIIPWTVNAVGLGVGGIWDYVTGEGKARYVEAWSEGRSERCGRANFICITPPLSSYYHVKNTLLSSYHHVIITLLLTV